MGDQLSVPTPYQQLECAAVAQTRGCDEIGIKDTLLLPLHRTPPSVVPRLRN